MPPGAVVEAPVPGLEAGCSSSTAQAAAASSGGGLWNSQFNSRQDPHKVPSNSKINPLTNWKRYRIFSVTNWLWAKGEWLTGDYKRTCAPYDKWYVHVPCHWTLSISPIKNSKYGQAAKKPFKQRCKHPTTQRPSPVVILPVVEGLPIHFAATAPVLLWGPFSGFLKVREFLSLSPTSAVAGLSLPLHVWKTSKNALLLPRPWEIKAL